jgi:hypothetical protein
MDELADIGRKLDIGNDLLTDIKIEQKGFNQEMREHKKLAEK